MNLRIATMTKRMASKIHQRNPRTPWFSTTKTPTSPLRPSKFLKKLPQDWTPFRLRMPLFRICTSSPRLLRMEKPQPRLWKRKKISWLKCKKLLRKKMSRGRSKYNRFPKSKRKKKLKDKSLWTSPHERCLRSSMRIWWLKMRKGSQQMEVVACRCSLISKLNRTMLLMSIRDQVRCLKCWTQWRRTQWRNKKKMKLKLSNNPY